MDIRFLVVLICLSMDLMLCAWELFLTLLRVLPIH